MTGKEAVLETLRSVGRARAEALRAQAASGILSDTEIIAQEDFIPDWRPEGDYTAAAIGAPVRSGGQVYGLLQPHNAADYPYRPAELPALWGIKHTTDPDRAKPWAQPMGVSGMYHEGECAVWTDGSVYRALRDTAYSPADWAADWERIMEV